MFRIGQSSDIHKFCEGTYLTIGGVKVPYEKGIEAHSDGDALCHAIAEAMLGALALGDLGVHFPDTDPKYKGMSSIEILRQVYQKIMDNGYVLNNLDALVLIEKPKMAPHIMQMRENIADVVKRSVNEISIKATRGEQMGFIGKSEGFAAQCVVLLKKENEHE